MTARLRRIFRYPDDSDGGEHTREELDEQEQEMVVRQLKLQNDRRDSEFRIFLTAIPMFAAIVLALLMVSASLSFQERFFSFLGVLSLIATSCTMKYSPLPHPEQRDRQSISNSRLTAAGIKLLFPINIAICGLLMFTYAISPRIESALYAQRVIYLLPGAMFTSIVFARNAMATVDLKQLEDLRYGYKGA